MNQVIISNSINKNKLLTIFVDDVKDIRKTIENAVNENESKIASYFSGKGNYSATLYIDNILAAQIKFMI